MFQCAHMDKCLSINLINGITTETTIIIMRVLLVTIWKRKKITETRWLMCITCLLEPEIAEFNMVKLNKYK